MAGEKIGHAFEIADSPRHLRDALHRTADDDDRTAVLAAAASATERMRATLEANVVTTTRPGASAIILSSSRATSVSDGLSPSRRMLVESRDQREHAFIADFTQPLFVRRPADDGRRVYLPVARVQHDAGFGADGERDAFGNRMRDANGFDVEGPEQQLLARRTDADVDVRRAVFLQARVSSRPAANSVA